MKSTALDFADGFIRRLRRLRRHFWHAAGSTAGRQLCAPQRRLIVFWRVAVPETEKLGIQVAQVIGAHPPHRHAVEQRAKRSRPAPQAVRAHAEAGASRRRRRSSSASRPPAARMRRHRRPVPPTVAAPREPAGACRTPAATRARRPPTPVRLPARQGGRARRTGSPTTRTPAGIACEVSPTTTTSAATSCATRTTRVRSVSGPNGSAALSRPIRDDRPPHRMIAASIMVTPAPRAAARHTPTRRRYRQCWLPTRGRRALRRSSAQSAAPFPCLMVWS